MFFQHTHLPPVLGFFRLTKFLMQLLGKQGENL